MGNLLSSYFPCMASPSSEPQNTIITIKSTSACCRGKIIQVKLDDEDKKEFEEIIYSFIEKLDKKENNISTV